jgi:Fe-S-cluster containining protein
MHSDWDISEETISVNVELAGPEWRLRTTLSVPSEPIALKELLPLFMSFADAVVGATAQTVEQSGEKISCKKGCGACCRQLVPISETEARWLRALLDRLPSARQNEIRERFAAARRRLAEAGLLEKLLHPEDWRKGEGGPIAMEYFHLGIACPFLENEACSIHSDRPLKCREYLVTSPAENCRRPGADNIKLVELPFQMWTAAARLDHGLPGNREIRWLPLILALEWTDAHAEQPECRPAHETLRAFFDLLSGKHASRERSVPDETSPKAHERVDCKG